jgi:hypothetical protein
MYMAERTARRGKCYWPAATKVANEQNIRCVLSAVFEGAGTAFSKPDTLRYEIE